VSNQKISFKLISFVCNTHAIPTPQINIFTEKSQVDLIFKHCQAEENYK